MKKLAADISREEALERLNGYINDADEIYKDISSLNNLVTSDKELSLNNIKEKYKNIKEALKADLKQIDKYETTRILSAFYEPALKDTLHNSQLLSVNKVALKNLDKLHRSLYDIQDYAGYWENQLESYEN
ncbi:Uncharacterised protein [Priestia megaterium]|uniref:hypothetical protein n=1 Tax=Priestia megaterium TaxID=1404 RepID=UPI000E156BE6|nr:hypothetical protein [Priestia megaterium]SUV06347.1 Uncharacterised protein [Priestia megaterium]